MAVVTGSLGEISHIDGYGGSVSPLLAVQVLFTLSGTYAQADNGIVEDVDAAIENSVRNGKSVTLRGALCGHPASKLSDPELYMGLKTVAVSGSDITFEVTESASKKTIDLTTELANGTVPAQERPFCLIVTYTED